MNYFFILSIVLLTFYSDKIAEEVLPDTHAWIFFGLCVDLNVWVNCRQNFHINASTKFLILDFI